MLLEFILALIFGIAVGSLTGLTPGIHINLVAPIFILLLAPLSLPPLPLIIFIVSLSITHTFVDFLPSTFLGCPSEDTSLSILPSQRMLLEGKAHESLVCSISGCLLGIFLSLILALPLIFLLPPIYLYLKPVMFFVLIFTLAFLLIKEKSSFFPALIIFLLSGFLGLASLNLNLNEPLLPLLSGLFGASSIFISIKDKNKLPPQEIKKFSLIRPSFKELKTPLFASILASPLCSFLPALGTNQAAVISSNILETENNNRSYLILIGSLNTLMLSLSFITLYAISQARTGSAVFIENLTKLTPQFLTIILFVSLLSGLFAFFMTLKLSRIFSISISKINYSRVSILILIFLSFLVFFFSGILGILVFLVATILGILCISLNLRRTNLMGSLMLSTLIFYI